MDEYKQFLIILTITATAVLLFHSIADDGRQGNTTVTGRESAKSLYSADLASMEIEDGGSIDYEPADAQASVLHANKKAVAIMCACMMRFRCYFSCASPSREHDVLCAG